MIECTCSMQKMPHRKLMDKAVKYKIAVRKLLRNR